MIEYGIPLLIKLSFAQEKNRLAFSYIIVVLSVVILFLLNHFHINERQITYSGFVILISSGLLWALRNIIVEIKNKKDDDTKNEEEKFCLMPFGPALLISSTICVFYLHQIKVYIF